MLFRLKRCFSFFFLGALVLLSGCGNGPAALPQASEEKEEVVITEESAAPQEEAASEETGAALPEGKLPGTREELLAFLKGEWTQLGAEGKKELGVLRIEENGGCVYTRKADGASIAGTLSFEPMFGTKDAPDNYVLTFRDIPEDFYPSSGLSYLPDAESSRGNFYIGQGEEEELLYFTETGNDYSFVASNILGSEDFAEREFGDWATRWLFKRQTPGAEKDTIKENSFYGFAFMRTGDKVLISPAKPHRYDAYGDYSDRHYQGAYFTMTEDGMAPYAVSPGLKTEMLLYEKEWKSGTPLRMYEITTDASGMITALSELDIAEYGIYDMTPMDPEYSYTGRFFTVNHAEYDMRELVATTDSILGVYEVGDYLVVECHANPHASCYELYDLRAGEFTGELFGTNLTWWKEDLSTAVYSLYNEVFDYWGNVIHMVNEGEISGLSYVSENEVRVDCWVVDGEEEKDFSETIEKENGDTAVFACQAFQENPVPSYWRAFLNKGEKDAGLFIAIDPPEKLQHMAAEQTGSPGELDVVVAVSLKDGMELSLCSGSMEIDPRGEIKWSEEKLLEQFTLNKGQSLAIHTTVPEGMPSQFIRGKTDEGEYIWEIGQLSGRTNISCRFIGK